MNHEEKKYHFETYVLEDWEFIAHVLAESLEAMIDRKGIHANDHDQVEAAIALFDQARDHRPPNPRSQEKFMMDSGEVFVLKAKPDVE